MKQFSLAGLRLFLLGFLTLFLELVLIRYLAGNIWNLGYFPSFVLIAVFIGMGIGFLFHDSIAERRSSAFFLASVFGLFLLIGFVTLVHPLMPGFGQTEGTIGSELFFTNVPREPTPWTPLYFALWFFGCAGIFALISQHTAKFFRRFRPLTAYTLDISGSCSGVLLFILLSYFQVPAFVWFVLLIPLIVIILGGTSTLRSVTATILVLLTVGLVIYQDSRFLYQPKYPGELDVRWSPYQKLEFVPPDSGRTGIIFANGVGHQEMWEKFRFTGSFYEVPHEWRSAVPGSSPYKKVLVLGSGAGNDVATALRYGAEHIDAVEIDPSIVELGRTYHPLRPYDDPRVHVIVGDGRAFLTRAQLQYDLIIFALTDSLVKVSPVTQLRLENYLFTVEAVERAWELLNEDGDLVFYNYYRIPWLKQKLQAIIQQATDLAPVVLTDTGKGELAVLAVGKNNQGSESVYSDPLSTDDWPFLYIQQRSLPRLYLSVMAIMMFVVFGLLCLVHRKAKREEGEAPVLIKFAFLFMGAAFLLLETKSVIQFSLLFGTTWLNNSLVFLAVLLLVLAANWMACFLKRSHLKVIYSLLMISTVLVLFYPLSNLLSYESEFVRFVLASLLTFLPIFFANLIFSISFRDQLVAEHVFGWNLIGAVLGGVIEYTSILLGYNALAVIVAIFYSLAFVCLMKGQRRAQLPVLG